MLTSVAVLATLLVIALYAHKRGSAQDLKLIGELAEVDLSLVPEGSVIVRGELWRARSKDGTHIPTRRRVRVLEIENHFAIVEACD
jgi:membrane-bound serine protease (ClpP class)